VRAGYLFPLLIGGIDMTIVVAGEHRRNKWSPPRIFLSQLLVSRPKTINQGGLARTPISCNLRTEIEFSWVCSDQESDLA